MGGPNVLATRDAFRRCVVIGGTFVLFRSMKAQAITPKSCRRASLAISSSHPPRSSFLSWSNHAYISRMDDPTDSRNVSLRTVMDDLLCGNHVAVFRALDHLVF